RTPVAVFGKQVGGRRTSVIVVSAVGRIAKERAMGCCDFRVSGSFVTNPTSLRRSRTIGQEQALFEIDFICVVRSVFAPHAINGLILTECTSYASGWAGAHGGHVNAVGAATIADERAVLNQEVDRGGGVAKHSDSSVRC